VFIYKLLGLEPGLIFGGRRCTSII